MIFEFVKDAEITLCELPFLKIVISTSFAISKIINTYLTTAHMRMKVGEWMAHSVPHLHDPLLSAFKLYRSRYRQLLNHVVIHFGNGH